MSVVLELFSMLCLRGWQVIITNHWACKPEIGKSSLMINVHQTIILKGSTNDENYSEKREIEGKMSEKGFRHDLGIGGLKLCIIEVLYFSVPGMHMSFQETRS